ncbi:MAG TPA: STAS domain-containing protein [Solirubrobacteraceae bacterium]|nr:STAS domain-containing protein [Solirubrobacteraceae bacterium]
MTDERQERRGASGIDAGGIRPSASYGIADRPEVDGIAVLALVGELDLAAAPLLRARIEQAGTGRALVIDFARVTFVDSAVLKELLRARGELAANGVRLVLAGVPMPVRRLLDLTRTSELFEDAENVEAALTQLSA